MRKNRIANAGILCLEERMTASTSRGGGLCNKTTSDCLALILLGAIVHLILIYAIFDIYYTSPIVRDARPQLIRNGTGVAKRVILLTADGLRARTFYAHPEKAPFLQSLIRGNKTSWGVSQSHVPTESRPGHVALFAGFYEDVSAITHGWKHNPVAFDSVFNRARVAYLFGSADTVHMFGDLPHAHMRSYSSAHGRFFDTDAANLDRWVFNEVEKVLNTSEAARQGDGALWFLHLLGMDTNGHGFKPTSHQYADNLAVVDKGIERLVQLVEARYNDSSTAYIFTADHGMTDHGSHGAGTDDEVLTPIVAWGAGVRGAPTQQLIQQVDVTPLQAALLNVPTPVNSMGFLPLRFLNASERYTYQASCSNFYQLLEMFSRKRAEKAERTLPLFFREAPDFSPQTLASIKRNIGRLVAQRRFIMAAKQCAEWSPTARAAIQYFHRFHRLTLGVAIAALFVAWNALLLTVVTRPATSASILKSGRHAWLPSLPFVVLIALETSLALYQRWDWAHLIYVVMPVYCFSLAYNIGDLHNRRWPILSTPAASASAMLHLVPKALVSGLFIGVCFGSFHNRAMVSALLVLLAPAPWLINDVDRACLALVVFPLLEPVGRTPHPSLILATSAAVSALIALSHKRRHAPRAFVAYTFGMNILATAAAAHGTFSNTQAETPWILSALAWFSVSGHLVTPLLVVASPHERLLAWISVLSVPYTLMSLAYESAFLILYCLLLVAFAKISAQRRQQSPDDCSSSFTGPLAEREWWHTLLLLALIVVAFFGTGNIASINSFNPSSIRYFMTTFAPFKMTLLLVAKIALPFFLAACAFCVATALEERATVRTSLLLLVITNFMALVFFFQLRDEGSWLDIGMSISNYLICMFTAIVVLLLLQLARWACAFNGAAKDNIPSRHMGREYSYDKWKHV